MNIWSYILRRIIYIIPVLLGVCGVVFFLFNIVGGDPAIMIAGKHATKQQILEIRHSLGLDKPLFDQYLDVVKSAFTLEFGNSYVSKQDIWEMIKVGAPVSLSFTLPAFILSTIFSVCISLAVAYYRGKFLDKSIVGVTVALMSIPSLAIILYAQKYFAYEFGWFEISGYEYGFPDYIPFVILPIIIWLMLTIGPDVRFYRTVVLDEVYQDYVRTARAKGLTEKVILFKHVLKNAMIPIITNVVIQIPFLILGALLIESFFSIPGLGDLLLNAINNSDFPVVKAIAILTSVAYITFNLITDILYTVVDPRIRLQ